MENERLIQGYFKNSLSNKELKEFNRRINNDMTFKEEFELYQDINSSLTKTEAVKLKDHLKNFEDQISSNNNKPLGIKKWYPLAAGVVIIGFAISFYINNSVDYYGEYFDIYPNVYQPIVRGEQNTKYYKAFQAYENQEFSEAVDAFNALEDIEENPNLQFYLAQSLLELNRVEEAEPILKDLSLVDFEFAAEVQWYLALVCLKLEDFDSSKRILLILHRDYPNFKKPAVSKLLQSLD